MSVVDPRDGHLGDRRYGFRLLGSRSGITGGESMHKQAEGEWRGSVVEDIL